MTTLGLIGIAAGCSIVSMLPATLGIPGYLAPIVVVTAGYALFQAANNTAVMKDVPAHRRGLVSGMLNLSRNLGLITGASDMGAVFAFAAGTNDMTVLTLGPFDPKRQGTSYIPNGVLDSGDAPMPSLRVDYAISPNTGGSDIGGVGALVPIDKHVVYSIDGAGSPSAHNLWAPYYASFIPATAAERCNFLIAQNRGLPADFGLCTTASGIDGPATGNNFHGFVNNFAQGGLYHFWDFTVAIGRLGSAIECPPFAPGIPAATPAGFDVVSVYTDEHGEARVGWAPGTGFFFGALPIIPNANNGCDIQGVSPLGTAVISTIARYPYQPVTAPDVPGDEVVSKTVTNLFNKQITCVPKGTGLANSVAFICTATAVGITGAPFVGEPVCFISNAEGIMPAPGFTAVPPPAGLAGAAIVCVETNGSGQASVEIFGKGALNVIANFTEEGLLRFISLAGQSTAPGGTSPANPPAAATQPATSTTAPTTAQVVSLGGSTVPSKPKAAQRPTLLSARLVYTKSGRKLVVRIRSTKATAKLRIVLRGAKGRTVATAIRSVRTNRAVTVPKLRIGAKVNRVTVSVLR